MKVAIIGSSGFVGQHLVSFLQEKGHEVFCVKRGELPGDADAIINLAGANIFGKRWNDQYKQEILQSRLQVCRTLKQRKPPIFLCASAIAPAGTFLASVAEQWEAAALQVPAGRTVLMRFGVVLGKRGGALPEMLRGVRWGLGAIMGSGEQTLSWISIHDTLRAISFCLENEVKGPVHFAAPEPIAEKRLMQKIAEKFRRPLLLHMPRWLATLLLGEAADELLFKSTAAKPEELTAAGFTFELPDIDSALDRELF